MSERPHERRERARHVKIAVELIERNVRDYVIFYTGYDGKFGFHSSNTTYAFGAARRVQVILEEQQRRDDVGT